MKEDKETKNEDPETDLGREGFEGNEMFIPNIIVSLSGTAAVRRIFSDLHFVRRIGVRRIFSSLYRDCEENMLLSDMSGVYFQVLCLSGVFLSDVF